MAFQQIDITAPDAIRTPGISVLDIEAGVLQSLCVVALDLGAEPAQTWCEIGLIAQGSQIASKFSVLAQGYIGAGASIGWSGAILMKPGFKVYAELSSSVTLRARFSALTDK